MSGTYVAFGTNKKQKVSRPPTTVSALANYRPSLILLLKSLRVKFSQINTLQKLLSGPHPPTENARTKTPKPKPKPKPKHKLNTKYQIGQKESDGRLKKHSGVFPSALATKTTTRI